METLPSRGRIFLPAFPFLFHCTTAAMRRRLDQNPCDIPLFIVVLMSLVKRAGSFPSLWLFRLNACAPESTELRVFRAVGGSESVGALPRFCTKRRMCPTTVSRLTDAAACRVALCAFLPHLFFFSVNGFTTTTASVIRPSSRLGFLRCN
ncbi:hypothetical protein EDB85DRAFT_1244378 [Lactarius pseudohatsudake]|nr:hypothetical protein EDB85DRAFT_1244378 [Lactarius pseudohatsudake]